MLLLSAAGSPPPLSSNSVLLRQVPLVTITSNYERGYSVIDLSAVVIVGVTFLLHGIFNLRFSTTVHLSFWHTSHQWSILRFCAILRGFASQRVFFGDGDENSVHCYHVILLFFPG
jgi:hypothetical protein